MQRTVTLEGKWTSAHYAFRFYADSNLDGVKDLVQQVVDLKN